MIRFLFFIPRIYKKYYYLIWNIIRFKVNGARIGKKFRVYNKMYLLLHKGAMLNIGDNFTLTSGDFFNPLSRSILGGIYAASNSEIRIGDNVGMSSVCIWSISRIDIGNNVKLGSDVILLDNDAHSLDYLIRRNAKNDLAKSSPIKIEDDVLIGTRSIILKGVTVGARSIIGAGSVVTKDIPADCIAAGNPCKVIKYIGNQENKK